MMVFVARRTRKKETHQDAAFREEIIRFSVFEKPSTSKAWFFAQKWKSKRGSEFIVLSPSLRKLNINALAASSDRLILNSLSLGREKGLKSMRFNVLLPIEPESERNGNRRHKANGRRVSPANATRNRKIANKRLENSLSDGDLMSATLLCFVIPSTIQCVHLRLVECVYDVWKMNAK